jgi:transposase
VAGVVPGTARHPLKKLAPDQDALLRLLHGWREEASQAGREIKRITVAFEAGRDGFWCHSPDQRCGVISRGHWRAKTDRLETALLKRVAGRAGPLPHGDNSNP